MREAELTQQILGAAIEVHRLLGPGLLESAYEECPAREFTIRNIPFERHLPIPVAYKDVKLECVYRVDFLVGGGVVVELKSIVSVAPVHDAVVLTYLRLSGCKVGLLINFYAPLLKDGIRRFVYDPAPMEAAKERFNSESTEKRRTRSDDRK
jgi:GxxExxY protein